MVRRNNTRFFSSSLIFLLLLFVFSSHVLADSHFEGFEAEGDEISDETPEIHHLLPPPSVTQSESLILDPKISSLDADPDQITESNPSAQTDPPEPSAVPFDFWDEDEFEGLPSEQPPLKIESPAVIENVTDLQAADHKTETITRNAVFSWRSYAVEVACIFFLIAFAINYFTGKRENEKLALAWATKFATEGSIFAKNFSLLGVGEGDDSPLLLKEAHNVFKFYASGRRYCHGLVATMELKSRHDLISRLFNLLVPCKDEINFEVYMNEEAMDHVILAVAKKKSAKLLQKELTDLQRFANVISPPAGRKWVSEELAVVSESKEVAGDLITDAVLDQVFGEKAYDKYGDYFISMHFSDQHRSRHRRMLFFKFSLPAADHMDDMIRLVALIPFYIDLIGHYKLSSQARGKTEVARQKAAQEANRELQNARQEAIQRKKSERKKLIEEAEAKLSAEALRKKESKERTRQQKKAMPKIKMSRGQ